MNILEALLLLCLLIVISAFVSCSELALASARKIKLQVMAKDSGDTRALDVLNMQQQPGSFITVVQIGLNAVAILAGIVGEAADIQELLASIDCEDGAFLSRIGKSRSTQYGLCRIALDAPAPLEPLAQSLLSSTLRLHLATPLLSDVAFSRNAREALDEEFLAPLKESAESDDFSLGRIFAAAASASNFVGVWNMRRPTQFGLAAGSIFELKKASPWTSRPGRRRPRAHPGTGPPGGAPSTRPPGPDRLRPP